MIISNDEKSDAACIKLGQAWSYPQITPIAQIRSVDSVDGLRNLLRVARDFQSDDQPSRRVIGEFKPRRLPVEAIKPGLGVR
jgi:hypothetical protein